LKGKEDTMEKELRDQIEAIKTSKISEKEKRRLIKLARDWAREERTLRRMPREERLKAICADALGMAVDSAIGLGRVLESKGIESSNVGVVKFLKQNSRFSLTTRLKQFKVLPLEG
jgi:hypothetical protein